MTATRRGFLLGAGALVLSACAGHDRALSAAPALPATASSPQPPSATAAEHGPRSRPEVALTFHAQGETALTAALLRELADADVSVTVFAVGSWLASEPRAARSVLDAGHELGNHTWSGRSSVRMRPVDLRSEITRTRDLLVRQTGAPGVAFRPSGMARATPLVLAEAGAAGYRHVVTEDVDPRDFEAPAPAVIAARVARQMVAGSILSLHVTRPTLRAVPLLLQEISRRGFRAVPVSDLLRPGAV